MHSASSVQRSFVVTCEHAGNVVPDDYRSLFEGFEAMLQTHRGWDPGALVLAEELAERYNAPLYFDETTRLLVDLNRSVATPDLHSEVTRHLPRAARRQILERYYHPYRRKVEAAIGDMVAQGPRVVHIASHSFTPELHGRVRTADVGLLYDPSRPGEVALAREWLAALKAADPALRLRRNYPYLGKSDGLTMALRRRHRPEQYVGIELEVNQRYVEAGGPDWVALRHTVIETLGDAIAAAMTGGRL